MALKLGPRGRRLWREMKGAEMAPARRTLLEEACRLADRLDQLDVLLRRDEDAWLHLREREGSEAAVIVVNNLLAEARQQQVAFKQLLSELRQGAAGTWRAERQAAGVPAGGGGAPDGVADLTARIAARRKTPAG